MNDRVDAVPEGAGPADVTGPGTAASRGGPPRPALIGLGALAAIAAILLVIVLVQREPEPAGEGGSPSPVASPSSGPPSATADASASPMTSPSPEPSSTPIAGPSMRWVPVGVFSSDGWAEEVTDMTYAAGQFIAIGYREPNDQRGQVGPPIDEPRVWISPDGREWEQVDVGSAFESGHPRWVVALPDGSAVAYGSIDPEPPESPRYGAWRTTDGRTWAPLSLTLPREDYLTKVVGGPHGLITTVSIITEESQTEEIWHSTDGASWSVVHRIEPSDGFEPSLTDWDAGPEGFVVTGVRYRLEGDEREDRAFVLASGDGTEWFEAPRDETGFSTYTRVAANAGDWIIAANEVGRDGNWTGRAATWFSANGLEWEQRDGIEIPVPSSPYPDLEPSTVVGSLLGTGERLIASGSVVVCCHGPWWAAGVWSSFDGRSWERLDFPEGTVVTDAAQHDGVVVLAGFDQARPEDGFRARAMFWIGEED